MSKLVFCLMGPTASGKTDLALQLVKQFPFEIISIDSAMIYRDMDIGTAKPDVKTLASIPHHLINIIDPPYSYSVAHCFTDVHNLCNKIIKSGKIPLLVGGTMMYFNIIQNGLSKLPVSSAELRTQILKMAEDYGWDRVYQRLQEVDPISAKKINPHDTQRIQRALEVFQATKKPLSSLISSSYIKSEFSFINLILVPENRSWLHERINERFQLMLESGLIDEVQNLITKWQLTPNLPSMRCVGYRQVFAYLSGELTYADMLAKGCAATRQLAKRQLTWLRKWQDSYQFLANDSCNLIRIIELINKILDNK